ncbi:unnamed protein product [Notodromas monacha]|uniref:Translational activator of cytochrome c oxidase 1 n=1 Tax=Notodromas monacha TaxID=399045 RepID=A0A7R9BGW0_9CRUS|nr:unnamed protein product [Notodromas monacha]CAG0915241.1 unnamed protein product [Notodromas monacha]
MNLASLLRASLLSRTSAYGSFVPLNESCQRLFCVTAAVGAGHSKWQNIRHTKAAKDQERAKMIQRHVYAIKKAVRDGGSPNPVINSVLANAMDRARSNGVPVSSMEQALKKAEGDDAKPYVLEVRGPSGVFLIVDLLTNNLRRSKQSMQVVLNKTKAVLADSSVRRLFEYEGMIHASVPESLLQGVGTTTAPFPASDLNAVSERILDHAIEFGAEDAGVEEDLTQEKEVIVAWFKCSPDDVDNVRKKVSEAGFDVFYAESAYTPLSRVPITDEGSVKMLTKLIEGLEGIDDVLKLSYALWSADYVHALKIMEKSRDSFKKCSALSRILTDFPIQLSINEPSGKVSAVNLTKYFLAVGQRTFCEEKK